ncbi:sensor histidine kinase [Heliomarina baculiformis]|uniref:sensor histidine kinase n=1 Tax=Heliomarina baculiformis TaxID=2872036 RepID=UPI001EE1FF85|nr:HAMP domain-containing sensor histidine kinase [Heliomarina baculiformis]
MLNTLSGRILVLTTLFVMLAEIFILVPSVSRYREVYLSDRLERAQIASLALLADDMIDMDLEAELLENAEVFNVVLRRDEMRQLVLSSPIPDSISETFDMRESSALGLMKDALKRLVTPGNQIIRVIGAPVRDAGLLIEITMESGPLRQGMIDYGIRVLTLSVIISLIAAILLFLAVRMLLVKPIKRVIGNMKRYAADPEDSRGIIEPGAGIRELREAEEALYGLQTELTHALRQKERLAQLGGAVARVSHDLRNILASAQLFTDRIETSEDPLVRRMAPKLVNSIARAISLCESTLAFGRAEEPGPTLSMVRLGSVVDDVIASESIAVEDSGSTLTRDVPGDMMLRADPEQLFRVILNLVRNAHQALISARRSGVVTISARDTEEAWYITVSDTGPGLPAKAREHLFQPFQGGARKGGSGLGLAIASELVRGHGGALRLVTSTDEGTSFEIRLPKGQDII